MKHGDLKSARVGAIAGIAFVAFFLAGTMVLDPLTGATHQELRTWWSDSGERRNSIISMYMWLLAAPCFLVFVNCLRARLQEIDRRDTWPDLVHGVGVAFVAVLVVTALTRGFIAQAIRFDDEPIPSLDTARYFTQFSQTAYNLGLIPLSALVVALASVRVLMTGAMSRWIAWLGFVTTAISVVGILLLVGSLATPLIALWVAATSVHIFRGTKPATALERDEYGAAAVTHA